MIAARATERRTGPEKGTEDGHAESAADLPSPPRLSDPSSLRPLRCAALNTTILAHGEAVRGRAARLGTIEVQKC